MWPYFTVPLEGHIRQVWLYLFKCVLHYLILIWFEAIIVDIERYLNLQLPMKSVPITTKVVSSNPANGDVYSIQHYMMKFISDLRQVSDFLRVTPVSSTYKTDCHYIAEILLKVLLNTIIL
jgi:hypothetical protein